MNYKIGLPTYLLVGMLSLSAHANDACSSQPRDSSLDCFLEYLQELDLKLNAAYQQLLSSRKDESRAALKSEQTAWVKARNLKCQIDDKESDRLIWLKKYQEDHQKTLCIFRETRDRVLQLERLAAKKTSALTDAKPASVRPSALADFLQISPLSRNKGKWYFEITLDRAGIAKSQSHTSATWPVAIWMGCSNTKGDYNFGTMAYIPTGDRNGPETFGFAIDLDLGQAHLRRNGEWQNGDPKNSNGKKIPLGQSYVCAMDASIAIKPMIENKLASMNLGESTFRFETPANFKPFHRGFLWIQAGQSDDRRLYFDYRQLQERPVADITFVKEEFLAPRDSGEGIPHHTSRIAQTEIDCATEQLSESALTLIAADGTAVAQIHKSRETDHRPGLDTLGGRFVRTVCFLRKHQVSLPGLELQESWDEMESPIPSVRIMEASARRQLRNGLLFVKQMNENENPTTIFGKLSRKLVAISAFDCKDISSNQLVGVRFDDHGTPIGIDFFMAKQPIRLEKNKKRLTDACASFVPINPR